MEINCTPLRRGWPGDSLAIRKLQLIRSLAVRSAWKWKSDVARAHSRLMQHVLGRPVNWTTNLCDNCSESLFMQIRISFSISHLTSAAMAFQCWKKKMQTAVEPGDARTERKRRNVLSQFHIQNTYDSPALPAPSLATTAVEMNTVSIRR